MKRHWTHPTLALALGAALAAAGCGSPGTASDEAARASHRRMVEELAALRDRAPDENPYLGDARAREFRARLAESDGSTPPLLLFKLRFGLGMLELQLGNEEEALRLLEQAREMLPSLELPREEANALLFRLGVANMRLGETRNCCLRFTTESCLLPIEGKGVHSDQEGAKRAIGYFAAVLQTTAPRTPLHLEALWLLNLAYMTIGDYPGGVPQRYRIPPDAFGSDEPFPRFTNVAPELGLDTFDQAGGVVADDFDGDGDFDLLVSSRDPAEQVRYFVNEGDGSFTNRTAEAGLEGILGGFNFVQADYDNDGDVDAFLLRGGWLGAAGRHPNSLLRNDGQGRFTDVAFAAGLGEAHWPTQTASWADYDNDGDVDLYVGNETDESLTAPCQLFRNEGDGTFVDVAESAGVTNLGFAKAVIWGDYDDDGYPDLYVSNLNGDNRLYHNEGDGTFVDVAPALGVTGPRYSFPIWFWDVNNDGALDLFVSAYAAGIAHLAAHYLGEPVNEETTPRLYLGDGAGGFRDATREYGLAEPSSPMGANFGDLDNDGYPDFYLGTGDPDYKNLMPNLMYRNREGSGFVDVTTAGGFGHLQKGHAIAFADLDRDGDQDVFAQMGGAYRGDKFYDALYENPGFDRRWIAVRLVGVRANRSAIGARIRVDVIEDGTPRTIYRWVNSGGSFGASPLGQTIGLGDAERIERIEVRWPAGGTVQVFDGVPLDRLVEIREGDDDYTASEPRAFRLAVDR